jgi:hypothetical protein
MKTKQPSIRKGIWFDKNNKPAVIDGVAQRNIKAGEPFYYYGEVL